MAARSASRYTARTADRHELYTIAVQAPEEDAAFFARWFQRYTGQPLRRFREDFCGTAHLAAAFVRRHAANRALGVDLDREVLDYARTRVLSTLTPPQRRRIRLMRGDVRTVRPPAVQLIAAMNFSWFVFQREPDLDAYVRNAWRGLEPGGVLAMDLFGGAQSQVEMQERRRNRGFTYVWDQARFDPITHSILCHIHFEFRDGTRLRKAFTYDWRLWTIPELRAALQRSGFRDVHVLWEGTEARTGRGNGVWRRKDHGEADSAWLAYVVGRK